MGYNRQRNVIAVGEIGRRSADPYIATMPSSSGPLAGVAAFGLDQGNYFQAPEPFDILNPGGPWIYTEVGAGAKHAVTTNYGGTPADEFPYLELTTGAVLSNSCQLQWGLATTAGSATVAALGPHTIFADGFTHGMIRFRVTTSATDCALFIGLAAVSTTVMTTHALAVADAIGFSKPSGAIVANGVQRTGSTNVNTSLDTAFTINKWYTFGWRTEGRNSIRYWYSQTLGAGAYGVTNSTFTDTTGTTAMPANTTALTPTIAVAAGNAGGAAATLDVATFVAYSQYMAI